MICTLAAVSFFIVLVKAGDAIKVRHMVLLPIGLVGIVQLAKMNKIAMAIVLAFFAIALVGAILVKGVR